MQEACKEIIKNISKSFKREGNKRKLVRVREQKTAAMRVIMEGIEVASL